MRRVRVVQVDAFTATRFRGNPAGVVPDASGLEPEEMQALAAELGNSETAFLLPPEGPDHDVRVRFFTPTKEVPSCGHATIASHVVRAMDLELERHALVQKTDAGLIPISIERDADRRVQVTMTQLPPSFGPPLDDGVVSDVVGALGLEPTDLRAGLPLQVVDTGHSKVAVPLRSSATLSGLTPDPDALVRISERLGCGGYAVFTLVDEPDALVHARMFAPAIGIPEDPVTGNASGVIGAYAVRHGLVEAPDRGTFSFVVRQGEEVGRPGRVRVHVEVEDGVPVGVSVTGTAVVVFSTNVALDD